jgi:hypothetical protein
MPANQPITNGGAPTLSLFLLFQISPDPLNLLQMIGVVPRKHTHDM